MCIWYLRLCIPYLDWLIGNWSMSLVFVCVFGVWITNVTAQDKPVLIGGQKWKQMLRLSWEGHSDLDMSFQENEKIRQGPPNPNPVLQQVFIICVLGPSNDWHPASLRYTQCTMRRLSNISRRNFYLTIYTLCSVRLIISDLWCLVMSGNFISTTKSNWSINHVQCTLCMVLQMRW